MKTFFFFVTLFCAYTVTSAFSSLDSTHFQRGMSHYLRLHYKEAGQHFTEASKENVAEAFTLLGIMHFRGELGEVDLEEAWKLAEEGVSRGDKKAYYVQGILWQEKTKEANSLTGNAYFKNAIPTIQQSADAGSIFWITRLAYCYNNGLGVSKNQQLAFNLYQKAVAANYAVAMHNLALMYIDGDYVQVDYEKALALFRKAVALGFTSFSNNTGSEVGIYDIAYAYHNGNDHVKQDLTKAMALYAESASHNYGKAYTGMGQLLNQNFSKAKEYLLKGIEAGDAEAASELALHYLDSDTAQCRKYYELALKMNDNSGYAEAGLSHLYKKNKVKSQRYAFQALAKGAPAKYVYVSEVKVGDVAPDFQLKNPQGELISLSSLRGQFVLIDFWASWCGPCRQENPEMVTLYRDYNKLGFEILGVSLDDDKERWTSAIAKDGIDWLHVSDLRGWKSAAGKLYSVEAIPHTVLLDKEGKVIAVGLRGEGLRQRLDQLPWFGKQK